MFISRSVIYVLNINLHSPIENKQSIWRSSHEKQFTHMETHIFIEFEWYYINDIIPYFSFNKMFFFPFQHVLEIYPGCFLLWYNKKCIWFLSPVTCALLFKALELPEWWESFVIHRETLLSLCLRGWGH